MYQNYKKFLEEFIAFKSISTDPSYKSEIEKTSQWLEKQLAQNGFKTKVITGYDNPLVTGYYEVDQAFETVLIYGHYDVQPASQQDGWDSEPFLLTEKNGRLVGRGAVDNKGQIAIHLVTVFELIRQKKLRYNIKFLIEGNEETGSDRLHDFLKDHKELLSSDYVVISDGEITSGHPVIEVGFRGVINASITLTTSDRDLHSGLYGGSVPNAALELTKLINKLYVNTTTLAVPGIYNDVIAPSEEELKKHASFPFSKEHHFKITGTRELFTEDSADFYTQTGLRPSLEITGLDSGYTGVGFKNAVPHSATVKLNMRIVPNQEPPTIIAQFKEYIESITPEYATIDVQIGEGVKPIRIGSDSAIAKKAASLLKDEFGKDVLYKYCAATIPIVVDFKELLNVQQLLLPFGNEDCNMHGANENFEIDLIKKDIRVSWNLLS